jgi:hypothetical protein
MFILQASIPRPLRSILPLALAGCLIAPVLACRPQEAGGTPAASATAASKAPDTAPNSWEGITYDPATPEDRLSVTPVKFEGTAEIGGAPADLVADFTSWIAGVAALGPGKQASAASSCRILGPENDRRADCDLAFARFGNFGRIDKPKNLWWAMNLDLQPGTPNGNFRAPVDKNGAFVYPANVRFPLPLVLMVQEEGSPDVIRLRPKSTPFFEGTVKGWPQGLMLISLSNGPIQFFREGAGNDAEPYLVLKSGTLAFVDKPSEFLRRKPQITSAQAVGPAGAPWKDGQVGGVSLTWTHTEALSSQLTGYNVYRKQGDGAWQRIASVAPNATSYLDKANDGKSESQYVVVHTMDYPFNRKYEGIYGAPAVVKPVVR